MDELKKQKRWVVWTLEEVNGRQTKVPYSIRGKRASSTDPKTWGTYEQAKLASQFFSGIGVIFTPQQTLLGIDIDHVLDENKKLVGEHAAKIKTFIKRADTYTEISPSGTGLHLYLALGEPLVLTANRKSPFEAYTSGRFFTFSENSFSRTKREVRTVSIQEAIDILGEIGYPWQSETNGDSNDSKTNACLLDQPLIASMLTDEELLEKMFKSKNGSSIKKLFDGDASEYQNDLSRADSALCSHLAFWSQRDADQITRLWQSSALGSRKKTSTRADYRYRTVQNAIKQCKEIYTPLKRANSIDINEDLLDQMDFLYTVTQKGEKSYAKNTENVCRALRNHPDFKGHYRLDQFKNRIEVFENELWRPFRDNDAIHVQAKLSIIFPFLRLVSKEMAFDALMRVSEENMMDSAMDFMRSLTWDGTARLDAWLSHSMGSPSDEYHAAVGSNWIKGLVKRIMVPGCKFDYVLVLEGRQGARKSTALSILGDMGVDNWHVETTMSTDSKDFFQQFEGKAIIEFSEGETLSRTEVKKMKSIITTASDRYRPSYGRTAQDFPRRCVFAMTTNQEEYLKDETGNRRWLPVSLMLHEVNTEWLKENRDQLFAEAYHRVITLHESVHEFPSEETERQQQSRRISDPNQDRIIAWYVNDPFIVNRDEDGITIQQVFAGALSGFGAMKKYDEMAIADVLKNVLKLEKRRRMVDGYQGIRWFPTSPIESPIQQEHLENDTEAVEAVEQPSTRRAKKNEDDFDDEDLPF